MVEQKNKKMRSGVKKVVALLSLLLILLISSIVYSIVNQNYENQEELPLAVKDFAEKTDIKVGKMQQVQAHLISKSKNDYVNSDNGPFIMDAFVEPTKVLPGDIMMVTAEIKDEAGIKSVKADMGGIETINLELIKGTVQDGVWQAKWDVHDTEIKGYTTKITATNLEGVESYASVEWSDDVPLQMYRVNTVPADKKGHTDFGGVILYNPNAASVEIDYMHIDFRLISGKDGNEFWWPTQPTVFTPGDASTTSSSIYWDGTYTIAENGVYAFWYDGGITDKDFLDGSMDVYVAHDGIGSPITSNHTGLFALDKSGAVNTYIAVDTMIDNNISIPHDGTANSQVTGLDNSTVIIRLDELVNGEDGTITFDDVTLNVSGWTIENVVCDDTGGGTCCSIDYWDSNSIFMCDSTNGVIKDNYIDINITAVADVLGGLSVWNISDWGSSTESKASGPITNLAEHVIYVVNGRALINETLSSPADPSFVEHNNTFIVNASITCTGGCDHVNGTVRYNASSANPDTIISETEGEAPFYIIDEVDTLNCSSPMLNSDTCYLGWIINATGPRDQKYEVDVLFSSNNSDVSAVGTGDATIDIFFNDTLLVDINEPADGATKDPDTPFVLGANVTCPNGTGFGTGCGNVTIYAQYCDGEDCTDFEDITTSGAMQTDSLNPNSTVLDDYTYKSFNGTLNYDRVTANYSNATFSLYSGNETPVDVRVGGPAGDVTWHSADSTMNTNTEGTNYTVDAPANLEEGDLVIVVTQTRDEGTIIQANSDFTELGQECAFPGGTGNDNPVIAVWWRIATDPEPTYEFTRSAGNARDWRVTAHRITGHNPDDPLGVNSTTSSEDVNSIDIPSITTSGANSLLVAVMGVARDANSEITTPDGMDEVYAYENALVPAAAGATETRASEGATGNREFTWTDADGAAGIMFEILPLAVNNVSRYYLKHNLSSIGTNAEVDSAILNVYVNTGAAGCVGNVSHVDASYDSSTSNLTMWNGTRPDFCEEAGGTVSDTTPTATIGNVAPFIENVTYQSGLGANGALNAGEPTNLIFSLRLMDGDQSDHDDTSIMLNITLAGGETRENNTVGTSPTCYRETGIGEDNASVRNYTCTVEMQHWDYGGDWNCTAQGGDGTVNSSYREVPNCFTVGSTLSLNMTSTNITWSSLAVGETNALMDTAELNITNDGNQNISNVTLKAWDLPGKTTPGDVIEANNFTATWGVRSCDYGQYLINGTNLQIFMNATGSYKMNFGEPTNSMTNNATHICLEHVGEGLSQQDYSATENTLASEKYWQITGGTAEI